MDRRIGLRRGEGWAPPVGRWSWGARAPRPALVLLTCLLVLAGCATAPETGRRQLLLVDPAEEARIGLSAFEKMKRERRISRDREANRQLQRVGRRIADTVHLPSAAWEFVLFEDDQANAFALPGGKVGVYTGILPITRDEAGLATVIAHEVAHVTARHGSERMSQGVLVQLGGAALSAALGDQSGVARELTMQAYGLGTQLGVMLPYSRTQELEADRIGLIYMARAGYDPREALDFWRRFRDDSRARGGEPPEFLSTHPLDATRLAALQRALPQALAAYERAR